MNVFQTLLRFYATQIIITLFLIQVQPFMIKVRDFSQSFNLFMFLYCIRISHSHAKILYFFPSYCVSMKVFVLVYDQKLYILDMRIMTPYLLPPDLLHCEITLQNTTFKRKTSQLIYPYFLPNVFLYQCYYFSL